MADTLTIEHLQSMQGTPVYSSEGDKIGKIDEVYVDQETGQPEWIGLGAGMLGSKRVLVPVAGADVSDDAVSVPYTKAEVNQTPDVDSDEISQELEARLYSHYGLAYSEQRSGTGLPERGQPTSEPRGGTEVPRGATDEGEVVRSEEELQVGKRDVEAGRARLRKWVETEPVEMDVELRREAVRVEREPIDQPVSGVEIGEQEIEVPVHAEEAVVQKQTVAKERIGLEKDVETDVETVTDEVRKERVDVEGDTPTR